MNRITVGQRRTLELLLVVALLAATLLVNDQRAAAGGIIEIPADGRVGGGIYSTEWFVADDFNALASATGKRITFGGTFHNIFENDGTNASWSNTREILDEVWRGKATPFANVGIDTSVYRIARGTYDAKIAEWATHVKQYLDIGGGRTVIIAPLQEMNYGPTPWGCDPGNYKIAFRKFVDTFRSMGLDETKVRWAFAPNNWTSPRMRIDLRLLPGRLVRRCDRYLCLQLGNLRRLEVGITRPGFRSRAERIAHHRQ